MSLGPVGRVARVLVGSAALSLATTLLTAALATYGVISIPLARGMLFSAGIILMAGILTSEYLCERVWKHVLTVGLLSALAIAGLLFWLDHWAVNKSKEREAILSVPVPALPKIKLPAPPSFATTKIPKPSLSRPANLVIGTQNVTGNTITQGPGSALSFNQQGGITAGTVNINTKDEWKLTESQKQELKSELSAFSGVEVSFTIEATSDNASEFASELAQDIFNLPGWKVNPFNLQVPPIAPGITIESPTIYNPPAAALQKKLQEIFGQPIPAIEAGTPPPNGYFFTLFIRRKK